MRHFFRKKWRAVDKTQEFAAEMAFPVILAAEKMDHSVWQQVLHGDCRVENCHWL